MKSQDILHVVFFFKSLEWLANQVIYLIDCVPALSHLLF